MGIATWINNFIITKEPLSPSKTTGLSGDWINPQILIVVEKHNQQPSLVELHTLGSGPA